MRGALFSRFSFLQNLHIPFPQIHHYCLFSSAQEGQLQIIKDSNNYSKLHTSRRCFIRTDSLVRRMVTMVTVVTMFLVWTVLAYMTVTFAVKTLDLWTTALAVI